MRKELISICLAGFLSQSFATTPHAGSAQISLQLKDVTVEHVLNEIEAKSDYHFLYNNKLVNVDRKVSLSVNEKDIETVLATLFNGTGITYQVNGNQVVLSTNDLNSNILPPPHVITRCNRAR